MANSTRFLIRNSQLAHQFLKSYLIAEVEELWAIALDSGQGVRAVECLFRGTVDACLAHPRDIFRFACYNNASAFIIAHNHPSQDLTPSVNDIHFTRRLVQLGLMMEIPLLDHLVLGSFGYVSMADLRLAGLRPPIALSDGGKERSNESGDEDGDETAGEREISN